MTFQVNYEALKGRSGDFKREAAEFASMIKKLTSQVRSLEGEWAGQSAESFFQEWRDLEKHLGKVPELLNDVAKQLEVTAADFSEFDVAKSKMFGVK